MTTYDTPVRAIQIRTWTRGPVMKVWAAAAIPWGYSPGWSPRCWP
jgi:hypothetical protein